MLTLDLPVEPYWLDLPRGVRVEIRPVTTAVMAAAQAGSQGCSTLLRQGGGESVAQQGSGERRQRPRSGIPCGEEV